MTNSASAPISYSKKRSIPSRWADSSLVSAKFPPIKAPVITVFPNSVVQARRLPSVSRISRLIELTSVPETLHSRVSRTPLGSRVGQVAFGAGDLELSREFAGTQEATEREALALTRPKAGQSQVALATS
jgi:hypothetical protein